MRIFSKKKFVTAAGLLLAAGFCIGIVLYTVAGREAEVRVIKIGVNAYRMNDTFIASIMSELEKVAKEEAEKEPGISVRLDISDAKGNQSIQNEQIGRYIQLDYDVICINMVDRTSAAGLIDQAQASGIPVVFFNREPVEEDIFRSENVYYIGSDPKESGILQGEMIAKAYAKAPESIDKNGNGVVEYLMLEGEVGHQDTIIRTEYSIKTLNEKGVPLNKIAGWCANFDRNQAAALMEQWIQEGGEIPEIIIANNDDMALGALDAFQKLGKAVVPMVGIDGTPQGKEAVDAGKMLGTAVSDAKVYANMIYETLYSLGKDKELPRESKPDRGRYLWVPWNIYSQK